MPPFAGAGTGTGTGCAPAAGHLPTRSSSQIVTLNVGGQLFQTTPQTLGLAGPRSILSTLLSSSSSSAIPFIDRDPSLFSLILSLLRTGRLPSSPAYAARPDDLLSESRFYGLYHLVLPALSGTSRFDPFALRPSLSLPLHGRDPPSALAAAPSGSILAAHGGRITLFDPSLRRRSTLLTRFPAVDSLLPLTASLAAAGAIDFPGLQVIDLDRRSIVKTLDWASHPSAPTASTVQAIGASPDLLFGSFESCRRNASAVVAFDVKTLRQVAEVARREVYGTELDSAIPASKLQWVSGFNLLMTAGSHSGPSGLVGNARLWDVRSSGEPVWELKEAADCFADITVSESLSAIFKVGMNSGEVFMVDMRKLSREGQWVCLGSGGKRPVGRKEGSGCRMESHGRHVFCSRGGEVEMWTEVAVGGSTATRREDGFEGEKVMRRNVLGRAAHTGKSRITQMAFGGNRMVVARKDELCVEVWESSGRS